MIIYEVNLAILPTIYNDYLTWLTTHVKKMLCFSGFIEVNYLKELRVDDHEMVRLTLQYKLDSLGALDDYLKNDAPHMQAEGLKKFPGQFTATRRFFEVISNG